MEIYIYYTIFLWSVLFIWSLLYLCRNMIHLFKYIINYTIQLRITFLNCFLPEFFLLLLYIAANVIAVYYNALSSSKYFSIINLSLLFLGGRTNIIIDYVGITLRQYYIMHLWVSIIVLIEAFIHIALQLEFGSFVPAQLSGIILMSLFIIIHLTFVIRFFLKRLFDISPSYTFVLYSHTLAALLILSCLGWHVWTTSAFFSFSWFIVMGTAIIWVISLVLRMLKWYKYKTATVTISNSAEMDYTKVTRLTIDTKSSITTRPGSYIYINLPGQYSSACVPITWWRGDEPCRSRYVDILINRKIDTLSENYKIRLGGPYGGTLSLGSFENIVLAAQGIGIAAIIPFALSLVSRKHKAFNDVTRNIDLYWQLDDNFQYYCAASYLDQLAQKLLSFTAYQQNASPVVTLLKVLVIYPNEEHRVPQLPDVRNWYTYKSTTLEYFEHCVDKAKSKPGRIVIAGLLQSF